MDPPGLERKLRIRALRFSWIKDAIQALAFTATCSSRRWSSASHSTESAISRSGPGGHLEGETIFFVRREEYSALNVELQLAWLPAPFPLRKECYTLVRDGDGVVLVGLPAEATRCRLSTVSAATGISLLQLRGAAPTR
jgi:hypothetical protein